MWGQACSRGGRQGEEGVRTPHGPLPGTPVGVVTCALLGLLITGGQAQCPLGGVEHAGKCYVIRTGSRSWDAARALCRQEGGALPAAVDGATQGVITRLMTSQGAASVWLDAREERTDWRWDADGAVIAPQGCYNDQEIPWFRDLQIQLTPLPDMVPARCIEACKTRGHSYAAVQSKFECFCGAAYGKYGLTGSDVTWCSIPCPGDETQNCGGWGKSSVYNVNGEYGAWSYRQPDGENEACAVLDTAGNDRKFADESCFNKYHYICDIPVSSCQPSNTDYHTTNGTCIYISTVSASWWEAKRACAEKGGSLLTVRTAAKHDIIRALLDVSGEDREYWTGLTRSKWVWKETGNPVSFSHWADRSPSGHSGRCLTITSTSRYKWVDQDCSLLLPTLCALPAPTTSEQPTTEPTTTEQTSTSTITDTTTVSTKTISVPTSVDPNPDQNTQNIFESSTDITTQTNPSTLNSTYDLTTQSLDEPSETTVDKSTEALSKYSQPMTESTNMNTNRELTTESLKVTANRASTERATEPTTENMSEHSSLDSTTGDLTTEMGIDLTTESILSTTDYVSEHLSTESNKPSTGHVTEPRTLRETTESMENLDNTTGTNVTSEYTRTHSTAETTEYTSYHTTSDIITETTTNALENTTVDSTDSTTKLAIEDQTTNFASAGERTESSTAYSTESSSQSSLGPLTEILFSSTAQNIITTSDIKPTDNLDLSEGVTTEPEQSTVIVVTSTPSSRTTSMDTSSNTAESTYETSSDNVVYDITTEVKNQTDDHNSSDTPQVNTSHLPSLSSSTPQPHVSSSLAWTPEMTLEQDMLKETTSEEMTTLSQDGFRTGTDSTSGRSEPSVTQMSTFSDSFSDTAVTSSPYPEYPTTTDYKTTTTPPKEVKTTGSRGASNSNITSGRPRPQPTPTYITNSPILSTLLSDDYTEDNLADDVTTDMFGDVTSPNDTNSTFIPGAGPTKDDDKSGWSTFDIVVVAGLVALALGLVTSMVVFLSCKKSARRCGSKSNKPPSAAGGSGGPAASGNGSIHNGLVLGVNGKSGTKRRKSGSGRYAVEEDNAEDHDLAIRDDLNVGITDLKKGKGGKTKRSGSLPSTGPWPSIPRTGAPGPPGPLSHWSTLPRYYYGMDDYAYANGSYDNNLDLSEPEVVQKPLPLRQEVYFRMSQVFADPKQEGNDPKTSDTPNGVSSPNTTQVLDPNGLYSPSSPFYETSAYDSSRYYDAFDPNQNTYSATFPRTGHGQINKGDQNNGQVDGQGQQNISKEPFQPNGVGNRLYTPAPAPRGAPHYGRRRAGHTAHSPHWDPSEGGDRRQDSINDPLVTDHPASPMTNSAAEPGVARTASDAAVYAQHNGLQGGSGHTVTPSQPADVVQNRTSKVFPQKPPRGPEIMVPAPPRVPNQPQPTRRAPPAPPPRSSSRNQDGDGGVDLEQKQNGYQPEPHVERSRVFLHNAEEGITWC